MVLSVVVKQELAEDAKTDDAADAVGRIVQLEETVINRIAAGEVVVRPANALKELMENSIDAKSKHIVVVAKAGGLKMLRIEDDGHGIRKDDMPILCERFTTSKLRTYEDLSSIGTFGFRGEALASISHVAHVTVTTMTAQDTCAHTAQYTDGRPHAPAKPCAGTRGTTIVVEDLFYNNPTRRQALAKESVEHSKILEVVQRYSMHYPKVSFSCRKASTGGRGSATAVSELLTPGGDNMGTADVVGILYGQALASELFAFQGGSEDPEFTFRGYASGPNYSSRTGTLIFFINHRLVECSPLKRAVEAVYAPVLPRHQHPWVYLELEVNPATIDVNVHPTKQEVQFLNEELIAQKVQEALLSQLKERGGSRTFGPAPLPPPKTKAEFFSQANPSTAEPGAPPAAPAPARPPVDQRKPEDKTRVRTDHLQRSLQSMWRESAPTQSENSSRPAAVGGASILPPLPLQSSSQAIDSGPGPMDLDADSPRGGGGGPVQATHPEGSRREAFEEAQQLTSICELRETIVVLGDVKLSKTLNQSVYVGPVSRELVLLQCGGTLCLVNLARVARECAYQRLLRSFGGVGSLALKEPLPLREVLLLGISDPGSGYDPVRHANVNVEALAQQMVTLLADKAEMLDEYFSMEISGGMLKALPNALGVASEAGLTFDGLPLFLVRVCAETDWNEEKACFESLCRSFADWAVETLLPSEEDAESLDVSRLSAMAASANDINADVESGMYEDVVAAAVAASRKRSRISTASGNSQSSALDGLRWLHEAVRRDGLCVWSEGFWRDGTVLDLVSLDQLYRIFERC